MGRKKKSANSNSEENGSSGNDNSPRPPTRERNKSRLRRHRSSRGTSVVNDPVPDSPDSAGLSNVGKKKNRRRRHQKKKTKRSSRAATSTGTDDSEESSEWSSGHRSGRNRIPTREKKKNTAPKELSEKDIVEWMQKMVPYVTFGSPFWNKWTLASLYHFVRNPSTRLCIAFVWEGYNADSSSSDNGVLCRFAKICKGPLITFNQLVPEYRGQFFYFLKILPVSVHGLNYDEVVMFGNVPGGGDQAIVGLNNLLVYYWTPILMNEDCLSEGIKNEVYSELNTVSCASQTTAHFVIKEMKQQLLLYIPPEVYREIRQLADTNEENAGEIVVSRSDYEMARDKPFAARLEETVVYWITKLKQLLILQELDDTDTWHGPLQEIQFWSGRALNLKSVLRQLHTSRVSRILHILAISHSPYLLELKDIFQQVSVSYQEASSNTHYLEPLIQPLQKLPKCKLKEVRVEMQKVIWLVLTIWRNAPHYNSARKLNGLLRKFSNVVVTLCRGRIRVHEILEGVDLPKKERVLSSCLKCLEWWQEIYRITEAMYSNRKENDGREIWIFDDSQIFVHVEAMILRIQNLQEICLVQTLYKLESFPLYPGIKGPYMTRVMKLCKETLSSKLQELGKKSVADLVLNVKNTEWLEYMKGFRETVIGMDMSVQNALEQVFRQMSNLKRKVEMMQLFQRFYGKREVITRQLDRMCVWTYEHFEEQVKRLKTLFEKKVVPLPNTYTELAGQGAWAEFMKRRLETDLDILKKAESWLPKTSGVGFQTLVKNEAKELSEAMSAFAGKVYEKWAKQFQDIAQLRETDHRGRLEVPLLLRGKDNLVKVNFDRSVYRNLSEAEMWKRMGRSVPPALLMTIYPWREKLHGLCENVGIVAKWYNRCVGGLSRDERLLFKDRLLPVEMKLYPCLALEGYTWTSERTADQMFLDEFREMTKVVLNNVKEYRDATAKVVEIIDRISRRMLVKVKGIRGGGTGKGDNEKVNEFRMEQNKRIERTLKKNVKDYREIGVILRELFANLFKEDGSEVRVQWGKYVRLVDGCLEEALKWSVQSSLQLLDAAVSGDDREKPLFCVNMVLVGGEVRFEPPLEEIANTLLGVHGSIGTAIEPVVRLGKFLGIEKVEGKKGGVSRGYGGVLMKDEICLDIQSRLTFAVERCLSEVNLYAERWIPYRDIWEVNRQQFMISYEKQYPDLAAYEKDLKRYKEISEVVHGGESTVTIRWLQVDCTGLKNGISEESTEWFQTLGATLYDRVKASLLSVYEYMEENRRALENEPETLPEQMEMWKVVLEVRGEVRQKLFSSFPGIHDRFKMLRQYNFELELDVAEMEDGLEPAWRKYMRFLRDTQDKLEQSRERIKQAYFDQFGDFTGKVNELQRLWETTGPFSRQEENFGCEWAREELDKFRNKLATLKMEEEGLILALATLDSKKEENLTLLELDRDIIRLGEVWKEVNEWENYWEKVKTERILNLKVDVIKSESAKFLQRFQQLYQQYEVKSWPIVQDGIDFIEIVQTSLKCCLFLRQQTLQIRHWEWIKGRVVAQQQSMNGDQLPSTAGELTTEMLVNFQLYRVLGDISDISWSAEKEMAVEQTLRKIEDFWDNESFFTKNRKMSLGEAAPDIPWEVLCSLGMEDTLMDHLVSLTAMKGSRFLGIFQEKVHYWDESLKMVEEVLKALWDTQSECLLLNKVFGKEHIQRALPRATRRYNVVSNVWAGIVLIIIQWGNVVKFVNETEDLVEMLEDLQEKMTEVREEFAVYLRGIRQEFPRFYCLPNDQLLTCLGGGTEMKTCMDVLPKIFGNLGSLRMVKKGESGVRREIVGIVSKRRKEELSLVRPVEIVGEPLESLFSDLEREINCSVKENLKTCLEQWGGNWNKLEEWLVKGIKHWTGQSFLTAIKIQWTADLCKAIQENKAAGSLEGQQENPLKKVVKRMKKVVTKCTQTLRETRKGEDLRLVNIVEAVLITLMYLMDVADRLHARNCADLNSFEWLQYLRWYWNGIGGRLVVVQGFSSISYGWEYSDAAASCRSCFVTPLTERCFLALTTAVGFQMGAVIHGGRDSGKRETIRALGCQLGKFVTNLRVDEWTEVESLKGFIAGVVQSGAWAVLSGLEKCPSDVINLLVGKLALITKAKAGSHEKIMLDGIPSKLDHGCGIFVVMSSSRQDDLETLTSLKSVMRPVALIQPDYKNIIEMKFFLGGFENAAGLAKRLEAIFSSAAGAIAKEQFPNMEALFSLSNMIVIVEQAVLIKQDFKKRVTEFEAVIKSLENFISPAFVTKDESSAFWDLVKTNFPTEQIPPLATLKRDTFQLEYWVRKAFVTLGYQSSEKMVQYCLRLYELIQVFKGVILVGKVACGKSVVRKVLKTALSLLQHSEQHDNMDESTFQDDETQKFQENSDSVCVIKEFVINPATVEGATQLFGGISASGDETWKDGILTKILKNYPEECNVTAENEETPLWLVFDGPIQDNWLPAEVEQLCRANGTISLANGDTIIAPTMITTIFETDTLADATPGLLTRCGILVIEDVDNSKDSIWRLSLEVWLCSFTDIAIRSELEGYIKRILKNCLTFRKDSCTSVVPTADGSALQLAEMFMTLLNVLLNDPVQKSILIRKEKEEWSLAIKQITAFSVVWSLFAGLDLESQQKASAFLKDLPPLQSVFPAKRTVFDYYLNPEKQKWVRWETLVEVENELPITNYDALHQGSDLEEEVIVTEETARAKYLLKRYSSMRDTSTESKRVARPVLLCGPSDSGKTKLVMSTFNPRFHREGGNISSGNAFISIQMTPKLKAKSVQSLIDSQLEAVSTVGLSPRSGKFLTVFIDDIDVNPTNVSSYGEFLRYLIDYSMWFDQASGASKAITGVGIVAAMQTGSTSVVSPLTNFPRISARLYSRFSIVYVPQPDEFQLRKIFTIKVKRKLESFAPAVKLMADGLTVATLDVYKAIYAEFQPLGCSESNLCAYEVFNLRDLSQVYEGLSRGHRDCQDTKLGILRLWFHECTRVFCDRLKDPILRGTCTDILETQLLKHFDLTVASLFPVARRLIETKDDFFVFGNFLSMGTSRKSYYGEIKNGPAIRKLILEKLQIVVGKGKPVAVFKETILHVAKIARVMSQKKGHLIIFGNEGQGRETLTQVAALLYNFKIFKIAFAARSNLIQEESDIQNIFKDAYTTCVVKNVGCCVILKDDQITENILELIGLVTGTLEIAELFSKKEIAEMMKCSEEKDDNIGSCSPDVVMTKFRERIQNNFHVVLCVKPSNTEFFNNVADSYAALLKNMSIIWCDIWTQESFQETASNWEIAVASSVFYEIHSIAVKEDLENVSITPVHFLNFLEFYVWYRKRAAESYTEKMKTYRNAIQEISSVRSKIGELTEKSQTAERKAELSRRECETMLMVIQGQEADTKAQEVIVQEQSGQLNEEIKEYEDLAAVIKRGWTEALKNFETETECLQDLGEEDLTHIRSYYSAPPLISRVLDAVMIMLDREQTWPEAKIQLGLPGFIQTILEYDKARISQEKLHSLRKFVQNKEFTPEAVAKYSNGARILCAWIHAIEKYGKAYLTKICPKREKLESFEQSIMEHKHTLTLASEKLQLLEENLSEIKTIYETKVQLKEGLEEDARTCKDMLDRATSVLQLLEQDDGDSSNHVRTWKENLIQLEQKLEELEGDALLTAAYLAYAGPFRREVRNKIKDKWSQEIGRVLGVPIGKHWTLDESLNFERLVSSQDRIQVLLTGFYSWKDDEDNNKEFEWHIENILIEKKSGRPVLCVDPHGMYHQSDCENESKTVEMKTLTDLMEWAEKNATMDHESTQEKVVFVTTETDFEKMGKRLSSLFTVVNYALSQQGLQNYFTRKIAGVIFPQDEIRRQNLVHNAISKKIKVDDFKEKIPDLVITCGGNSILNNGSFPETLSQWWDVTQKSKNDLRGFEAAIREIELERHQFRYTASMFTRIFETITEMSKICSFYYLSLEYFTSLIENMTRREINDTGHLQPSGETTESNMEGLRRDVIEKLIDFMDEQVSLNLFKFSARSMIKPHRHQFSLLLSITTLLNQSLKPEQKKATQQVVSLLVLLRPTDMDWQETRTETDDWLTHCQQKNLKRLVKLKTFHGLSESIFTKETDNWREWMLSSQSEKDNSLPGNWESRVTPLEKLLIILILRPDLISYQIQVITETVLGVEYAKALVSSQVTDVNELCNDNDSTHDDHDHIMPSSSTVGNSIIILLMDNYDKNAFMEPQSCVQALANSLKPPQKVCVLSISKGSVPLARSLIEEGSRRGFWVFLSNCHFLRHVEWLCILDEMLNDTNVHRNFKLWMCARANEQLPRKIVQNSIKVVIEPLSTLQLRMARLQQKMGESSLLRPLLQQSKHFRMLVNGLSHFHCQFQGRAKYRRFIDSLAKYPTFLDVDFEVSLSVLKLFYQYYLASEERENMNTTAAHFPWWALKLMLELQYKGHFSSTQHHQFIQMLLQKSFSPDFNYKLELEATSVDGKEQDYDDCENYELPSNISSCISVELAKMICFKANNFWKTLDLLANSVFVEK